MDTAAGGYGASVMGLTDAAAVNTARATISPMMSGPLRV
jgi:hypothetical protein